MEQARLLRKPSAITTRRNLGARTRRLRPWIRQAARLRPTLQQPSPEPPRPVNRTPQHNWPAALDLSGKPPRWSRRANIASRSRRPGSRISCNACAR